MAVMEAPEQMVMVVVAEAVAIHLLVLVEGVDKVEVGTVREVVPVEMAEMHQQIRVEAVVAHLRPIQAAPQRMEVQEVRVSSLFMFHKGLSMFQAPPEGHIRMEADTTSGRSLRVGRGLPLRQLSL